MDKDHLKCTPMKKPSAMQHIWDTAQIPLTYLPANFQSLCTGKAIATERSLSGGAGWTMCQDQGALIARHAPAPQSLWGMMTRVPTNSNSAGTALPGHRKMLSAASTTSRHDGNAPLPPSFLHIPYTVLQHWWWTYRYNREPPSKVFSILLPPIHQGQSHNLLSVSRCTLQLERVREAHGPRFCNHTPGFPLLPTPAILHITESSHMSGLPSGRPVNTVLHAEK